MHDQHALWFETFRKTDAYKKLHDRPIAYFCTEYAISDYLQTYSGGLGVLAGDIIREASDQKVPFVAVGLFYRQGYFHHEIGHPGVVLRNRAHSTPEEAGLTNVLTPGGTKPLKVLVPIENRQIYVQAWRLQLGLVSIYLLDTDVAENNPDDRRITDRLYVADRNVRFKQEMILGIGGLRIIEALSIHPSVLHMNEGHSALLTLEHVQHEMNEHKTDFMTQLPKSRDRLVFTNHTLLPVGNERFAEELVKLFLTAFAREVGVDIDEIMKLGKTSEEGVFSMTSLAFNMAATVNAVSKLHAEKAKIIWPERPMIPVTNGIHISSWDGILEHENLWVQHQYNKDVLLRLIKETSGQVWGRDDLLLGWAKRVVAYKRPLALFEDLERFMKLAKNSERPIRIVMSGNAHETDLEGAAFLSQLEHLIANELNGVVVYLSNYQTGVAKLLTQGCDVWLNTPIVGYEACGTSGMKASLNGVLPLTTRDGWVSEVELFGVGWALNSDEITKSIMDELEFNIAPIYYQAGRAGWIQQMTNARELILKEFSATKMLRTYIEQMYLKSIEVVH